MNPLADLILKYFRGRHDHIAVANGAIFAPSQCSPSRDLIERHLRQQQSYGFYLMAADSKVWCTCVDFDNKPENPNPNVRSQTESLYLALSSYGLAPLVERSQSGNGYHVWLFFGEATDAWVARAWWRGVEQKMRTTFKEIYPRQDRLTGKGLGNLVRYPLWNKSKFVNPELAWEELDSMDALGAVRTATASDLYLLAFQLGMGDLVAEPTQSLVKVEGAATDGVLPLRVQKLIENRSTLLSRRWHGDTQGMKDTSNSAVAMALAVEMVRLYVPTPEIASAVRFWCRLKGAEKGEREDWINLTVTKAYDFIISRKEKQSVEAVTFEQACNAYIDLIEKGHAWYHRSGIDELDLSIDGVGPGELCVIAARPGHGKSALAFQWLDRAARNGIKALLISEEMSHEEIGKRRLLGITPLDQEHWTPAVTNDLRREVKEYFAGTEAGFIVEGCNTIERVEEVVDQFVSIHGVGIVAVDYLQLLRGRNSKDRYEMVTEMSRALKQCAKRNHIPMLMLSQLNREVEKRPDNEPKLSDLRESGGIEQDADLILFLQWPHKFDHNAPVDAYRIYCAKRRNGPIRTARIETKFKATKQWIGQLPESPGWDGN